jgi:hypothetical protein
LVPLLSISMRCAPLLVATAILAASCGGPASSPSDAGTLVERAADAMSTVTAARFRMECSGAPMTVEGFEFQWAEGQFAAPSSSRSVLHMRAAGLAIELGAVSIGDRTWLTNPLSGAWDELAPGVGFNPAVVFDPSQGWVALLADLADVAVVGREGGRDHLTGTLPPARVKSLTAGLVADQAVVLGLWLDSEDGHILRAELSTTGDAGVTDWVIELSEFDKPATIEQPATG